MSATFENKITALLKGQNFDVVQLEGLYLCPYIPLIRQNSDALIAFRAHNIEHEIWERIADEERNPFKRLYFRILSKRIRRFENRYLNTYDLLVPITNRDLVQFSKQGNIKPAFVCPAGVNVFNSGEAGSVIIKSGDTETHDGYSLFFIGSLDWIPNQEGLLWFTSEVLPLLTQRYPNVKLHVAGRNASDKLVKRLNVPGVIFYGEVKDSQDFMKSKGILVSPCFSGGGMRLKIVEAMALGKSVVTTPIGAEGLAVEHNMNILIANNAWEFYLHLERLMNNPDLCQKIGHHAREFASAHYNNQVIASALADFYKENMT
jgi:glycosyltransferase involved in cell wall biosynthesis